MDLVVEPDFYVPNIDESGRYVDKVPSFLKKRYSMSLWFSQRKTI